MPSTVFDHPIFPGAKTIKKTITVTNTSGAYSETITDDRISAGMQVNKMYIEDPSVFRSDISVQTLGGSFVFSCSDVAGTTDVTLEFLKIADDPNGITSTEFNILNNKIGEVPSGSTLQGEIDTINGNLAKYMTNPETATAVIQAVSPATWTEYTMAESGWYKFIAIRDSATNNVDVRLPTGSVPTGEPLMSAADGGGNRFVLYVPLKAGTKIRVLCSNTNCKFSAVRY